MILVFIKFYLVRGLIFRKITNILSRIWSNGTTTKKLEVLSPINQLIQRLTFMSCTTTSDPHTHHFFVKPIGSLRSCSQKQIAASWRSCLRLQTITQTSNMTMSPQSSFSLERYLIGLNTEAFSQLCFGEQDQAIAFLQQGLTLVKAQLQYFGIRPAVPQDGCVRKNTENGKQQQGEEDICSSLLLPLRLRDFLGTLDSCASAAQQEGGFLFYRNFFMIQHGDADDENDNNMDEDLTPASVPAEQEKRNDECQLEIPAPILYAILAYNLGVIHHELGMSNHGNFGDLALARTWYQRALVCMYAVALQEHSEGQPKLLMMALFTNLGHVSSCFQDVASMHNCHQGLGEVLRHIALATETSTVTRDNDHDKNVPGGSSSTLHDDCSFASDVRFFHRSWSAVNRHCNRKCAPAA